MGTSFSLSALSSVNVSFPSCLFLFIYFYFLTTYLLVLPLQFQRSQLQSLPHLRCSPLPSELTQQAGIAFLLHKTLPFCHPALSKPVLLLSWGGKKASLCSRLGLYLPGCQGKLPGFSLAVCAVLLLNLVSEQFLSLLASPWGFVCILSD